MGINIFYYKMQRNTNSCSNSNLVRNKPKKIETLKNLIGGALVKLDELKGKEKNLLQSLSRVSKISSGGTGIVMAICFFVQTLLFSYKINHYENKLNKLKTDLEKLNAKENNNTFDGYTSSGAELLSNSSFRSDASCSFSCEQYKYNRC